MTRKLEGNGLWESSRMILPQYRERIVRAAAERDAEPEAAVHEDRLEEIAEAVKRSLALGLTVRLELRQEEGHGAEGIVVDASPLQGMLRLRQESGKVRRIAYRHITGASLKEC
ncbi:hypothetical protein [Saccharibacillus deserti]|uniref:hypothetical protein n=1 Tax=Saccharibacillus deserti TaxID=1634444 RepID=UPI001FE86438|nr:hypothetical protein [Saccharibacillus deserti]